MSDITASAKAMDKEKDDLKPQPASKRQKESPVAETSLNMTELRELAELVAEHGFTDFEFENEKIRVRLSKMSAAPAVTQYQPAFAMPPAANTPSAKTESSPAPTEDEALYKITSPIVGTFYSSPSPDKDPYVSVGSSVTPETVVCIVEAMKLMNEIQAETSGRIVEIYVENGQPVEYGQPLFGLKS